VEQGRSQGESPGESTPANRGERITFDLKESSDHETVAKAGYDNLVSHELNQHQE
jgi:hypothetical protein